MCSICGMLGGVFDTMPHDRHRATLVAAVIAVGGDGDWTRAAGNTWTQEMTVAGAIALDHPWRAFFPSQSTAGDKMTSVWRQDSRGAVKTSGDLPMASKLDS